MENKTILYLNSKVWYRLLKVIYILSISIILLIGNGLVFNNGIKSLDLERSILRCNTTGIQYPLKSLNIYFGDELQNFNYANFYSNSSNDYDVKAILAKCTGSDQSNINLVLQQRFVDYSKQKENSSLTSDEVVKKWNAGGKDTAQLTYNFHLFDITLVYSYKEFLSYFIITNSVIILAFFLIKGTFYYILLGKFRPKE